MAGYRETTTPPTLCGVTEAADIHVLNGSTLELAFPCLYAVPTGETLPSGEPEYEYEEIELIIEGYADPPIVAFEGAPAGLTAEAWIDDTVDLTHVIRLVLTADCASAVAETQTCTIAMTITRPVTDPVGTRTDTVLRGRVVVVAAPLPAP